MSKPAWRDAGGARRYARYQNRRVQGDVDEQFRLALAREGITQAEFARRIGGSAAGVSRDLSGGLREAKLNRLRRLADAISYELLVTLRRKGRRVRRRKTMD